MDTQILLGGVSVLVLTEVVVKVLKTYLNSRFLPLVAFIAGTLIGIAAAENSGLDLVAGAVGGFLSGAATVGFYEFGKTTIAGK